MASKKGSKETKKLGRGLEGRLATAEEDRKTSRKRAEPRES